MLGCWRHLLVKDVFDVVCAKGFEFGRFFDGPKKRGASILILEAQQPADAFLYGLMVFDERIQKQDGLLAQRTKSGDVAVVPEPFFELFDRKDMCWQFDTLVSHVAAGVGGDFFIQVKKPYACAVGLQRQGFSDGPGRNGVGVGVKANGKVLVHQGLAGISAIGKIGKGCQVHLFKAVQRAFSRGFMGPHIGDVGQPPPYLAVDVIQVLEGTKGEKIGSKIFDARFDFTFFMGGSGIASDRGYRKDFQKIQESVVEPDDAPLSFDNGGQHVVDHDGFGRSPKKENAFSRHW